MQLIIDAGAVVVDIVIAVGCSARVIKEVV